MITNERQYEQTRKQLSMLESLLASTQAGEAGDDGFRDVQAAGLTSQIQDLRDELTEYEQLRDGVFRRPRTPAPAAWRQARRDEGETG